MSIQHLRVRLRALARYEAIIWIALVAFIGYRIWPQVAAAFGVASTERAAPAFELTTLSGDTVSDVSLKGKVVLVNFWATWCPPCRVEMPGFQAVYDQKKDDGFVILGISTDAAGREPVERFLEERSITYPVAMATGAVTRSFGGGNVLPTSFLLDRDGRIRYQVKGIFASVALAQAVDRLLAEPASSMSPSRTAQGAAHDLRPEAVQ